MQKKSRYLLSAPASRAAAKLSLGGLQKHNMLMKRTLETMAAIDRATALTDAIKPFSVQSGIQELAAQMASGRLSSPALAMADAIKPVMEARRATWGLASQLAFKGLQFPILAASDPIKLAMDARRTWGLASQLAFKGLQFPTLAVASAAKLVTEAQLKWELAAQPVFRESQFPILAAASAAKPVTEAQLKRELAAQPVFSKLRFPTLSKIDALEPEVEAQRCRWELMLEQLLGARRLPISTTSDGRDLSLTFNSTRHSDDMQIVCGWRDQKIVITEPAKSAYEIYLRGDVSRLVDILYKRLRSCIETALHEQFGPNWQKKNPKQSTC